MDSYTQAFYIAAFALALIVLSMLILPEYDFGEINLSSFGCLKSPLSEFLC